MAVERRHASTPRQQHAEASQPPRLTFTFCDFLRDAAMAEPSDFWRRLTPRHAAESGAAEAPRHHARLRRRSATKDELKRSVIAAGSAADGCQLAGCCRREASAAARFARRKRASALPPPEASACRCRISRARRQGGMRALDSAERCRRER